jgi:2,3-bisphosphoglycerate-independent phosphoglycerate mutase
MGLFGPGGVHAHEDHLHALITLAHRHEFERVYLHLFLDGRDVLPRSALGFLDTLEGVIARLGTGTIATVSGRYYAMDRDKRWERSGLAYAALVNGNGRTLIARARLFRLPTTIMSAMSSCCRR